METVHLWKMRTNQAGNYKKIGARSSRRVSKAKGTIAKRPSCGTFKRRLAIYSGNLIGMNLMKSLSPKRNLLQAPMGFRTASTSVQGIWGSVFLFKVYQHFLAGDLVPAQFAASRTVFKDSTTSTVCQMENIRQVVVIKVFN